MCIISFIYIYAFVFSMLYENLDLHISVVSLNLASNYGDQPVAAMILQVVPSTATPYV